MRWDDLQGIYRDFFKGNKTNMFLLRLSLFVLILFFSIVAYKSVTEPVKIFGIELNQQSMVHDTIFIRDTIIVPQQSIAKGLDKSLGNYKSNVNQVIKGDNPTQINITSNEQKGGQTAAQINN